MALEKTKTPFLAGRGMGFLFNDYFLNSSNFDLRRSSENPN
jgi:hypothetical protein